MIELPQFLHSFETVNFALLRTYPLLTGQAEPWLLLWCLAIARIRACLVDTTRDAEEF
jgi:hypothetical protein